jgi:uncharacterized protein YqgC (DUF456 family)
MIWVFYILLVLSSLGCLVLVAMTLPGLWLMTALAAIYSLISGQRYIGWRTLIALGVFALVAELIELYLGGAAAKVAGGGRRAMIGGLVGGVLGGIFLSFLVPIFIIGTILGICLGSFIGAAVFEWMGGEKPWHSLQVGAGAATGRFLGIVSKLAFGVVMFLIVLIAGLPIGGAAPASANPPTSIVAVPPPSTHPSTHP